MVDEHHMIEVRQVEELDFRLAVEALRRRVLLIKFFNSALEDGANEGLKLQLAAELSEAKQLAKRCPHCRDLQRELDLLKVVASEVLQAQEVVV
jgi:hypothetical protein